MKAKRGNPLDSKIATAALRGPQLRAARGLRNMSRTALAKATGISYATIQRHERGLLRIKPGDVEVYAAAMAMSIDELKGIV